MAGIGGRPEGRVNQNQRVHFLDFEVRSGSQYFMDTCNIACYCNSANVFSSNCIYLLVKILIIKSVLRRYSSHLSGISSHNNFFLYFLSHLI